MQLKFLLLKDLRIIALANSMGEYLKVEGHRDLVRDTRYWCYLK